MKSKRDRGFRHSSKLYRSMKLWLLLRKLMTREKLKKRKFPRYGKENRSLNLSERRPFFRHVVFVCILATCKLNDVYKRPKLFICCTSRVINSQWWLMSVRLTSRLACLVNLAVCFRYLLASSVFELFTLLTQFIMFIYHGLTKQY